MNRQTGFTLLEILVALAVLGLAMGALIQTAGSHTLNQAHLRDRTLAEWVAHNLLVQQQLDKEWPSTGDKKGDVEYAGRDWRWTMKVVQTADEDLRRVDIAITPADAGEAAAPTARLTGFLEQQE